MAWDSKSSRKRQNSHLAAKSSPISVVAAHPFNPKSSHVADPTLQPFLAPTFHAADFFNSTLPTLQSSSTSISTRPHEVPLATLSTETQNLLSQLSAHTSRLSNVLTQLTDEIIRSGSRLPYEVEVLRQETLGLSEALTETLDDDITKFVPHSLSKYLVERRHVNGVTRRRGSTVATTPRSPAGEDEIPVPTDPKYIAQLRTLNSVRNQLDTVIKTFGVAMSWTFPPSEVSVSSAFLSVSAPEPGSDSVEEKGQQTSKALKEEITDLLRTATDPLDGIESATKRVEELKELAIVWKGTAEERARLKFVDGLAKLIEDRHREVLRNAEREERTNASVLRREGSKSVDGSGADDVKSQSGYGFINQLQKIRGGL